MSRIGCRQIARRQADRGEDGKGVYREVDLAWQARRGHKEICFSRSFVRLHRGENCNDIPLPIRQLPLPVEQMFVSLGVPEPSEDFAGLRCASLPKRITECA